NHDALPRVNACQEILERRAPRAPGLEIEFLRSALSQPEQWLNHVFDEVEPEHWRRSHQERGRVRLVALRGGPFAIEGRWCNAPGGRIVLRDESRCPFI